MAAKLLKFSRKHISKNCRCQTCCIGIDQEKQRLIAENLCTQLNQIMDTILNLPDLPLRSTSIRRRIHNDRIIMVPSADFTLNKLHTVIHQPSYRRISQSRSNRILLRPGDHTLRSIHMSNRSPRCCCRQSRTTCICKKIQHLHRTSRIADLIAKPVPIHRLLRKKPGMLKTKRFQIKGKSLIMNIPLLGQIKKLPFTAALLTSVIMPVHMLPALIHLRRIPYNLRIRPHQKIIPPTLQLLPTGSINNLIIFPSICNPHRIIILLK